MGKVIITGANGFIGSSLVKRMLEAGVEVFAVDIDFSICRVPDDPLVHFIETGLDDIEKLQIQLESAKACDAFYHLAWRGVNGPDKADPVVQLNNIRMAMNCAGLAKAIGSKRFLCAGTIAEQSVKSLPNLEMTSGGMMYGVAKHCTHLLLETYCKRIGQPFIWMQFSNIYGVGNKTGNLVSYTLGELLSDKEPSFGPAAQPYDFIYVNDLIEAVYRLGFGEVSKSAVFIGSGNPRVLKDYLLEIGDICGKRDAIRIGLRPDDGIRYSFDMFNTDALRSEIGDYVSTSFTDGIKRTLDWLKEV